MMDLFNVFYLIALLLPTLIYVETKRVLGLFPHFGYSHFKVFYPLLRTLSEKGHNVTVITYIKSKSLQIGNYEELILKGMDSISLVSLDEMKPRTWKGLFEEYLTLHKEGQQSCKRLYESGHIDEVLKRNKEMPYDLVITENFNSDCQLAVPYLMKTPIVALSSCLLMPWYYERILLPDVPSFVQSEFIGFSTPLNLYDRLLNFVQSKVLSLLYRYYTNYHDNKLIYNYLNVDVNVNKFAKQNTRLIFGNQHYSLTGIRPSTQQFIEIGGIHINESELNKSLLHDIDLFLKTSKNDILFISWGSMIKASTIDQKKFEAIIKVLGKLNLNIIWKWETDEVPFESKQFLFIKWVPQFALLCHPKITLFWGHGGILSTIEAVYCGKPMLLTPIYGDQFVNAYAVVNRKIGRIIDFNKLAEINLKEEILQALHPNYSSKAQELSKLFRDRESKPLNTAVWWVEHLLNHKLSAEVLHSHAVNLNWFVFYSLDAKFDKTHFAFFR